MRVDTKKLKLALTSLTLLALALSLSVPKVSAQESITTLPIVIPSPNGIAVNPDTNRIYVASKENDAVYVIDGSDNSPITRVRVGEEPFGLAVNPITNKVYVANFTSDTVSVIDGDTNTKVTDITLGGYGEPCHVAVNPMTNEIYVALHDGDRVAVIDGATDTLMRTVNTGAGAFGVAFNPVSNKIYVSNRDVGSITVIDGSTHIPETEPLESCGGSPYSMKVNTSTGRLYVTCAPHTDDPNHLAVYKADGTRLTSIPVGNGGGDLGAEWVNVNPNNNQVYVTNSYDDTFYIIDGSTNTVDRVLTTHDGIGNRPSGIGVNPDRSLIYVGNQADNSISVISLAPELVADFSADPLQGIKGSTLHPPTVDFTDETAGGVPPYSYDWDFGDGGTSSEQNPTHTYDPPGTKHGQTYTVTLTVEDSLGASDTEEKTDYITIYQMGDINLDLTVNALDITKIELIVAEIHDPTKTADANEDTYINALDITRTELLVLVAAAHD